MFIYLQEKHVKYVIHIGDKYNEKVKDIHLIYMTVEIVYIVYHGIRGTAEI